MSFGKAAAKIAEAPSLLQDIDALAKKIDAYIAERVDERAAEAPGVPKGVIERTMIGRAGGCRCLAAKMLSEK